MAERIGGISDWDAQYGDSVDRLSWDEVRVLQEAGIYFGCHSSLHRPLTGMYLKRINGRHRAGPSNPGRRPRNAGHDTGLPVWLGERIRPAGPCGPGIPGGVHLRAGDQPPGRRPVAASPNRGSRGMYALTVGFTGKSSTGEDSAVSSQETKIEILLGPETGPGASDRTRGSLSDRWEIIQVRLDQPLHPVRMPENAAGAYLVFWWNNIPLGDTRIFREEFPLNKADLHRRITKAIASAVGNYLLEDGFKAELPTLALARQHSSFHRPPKLESLVALHQPLENLVIKVPRA